MDATLYTSVEVNRTQPRQSGIVAERGSMLRDHCRRIFAARKGFRVYGLRWFLPWLTYCFSPVINRIARGRMIRFKEFNVRLGDGDLYTFANIFADYPVREIERGLSDVDLVVDLGANVGAFSCLIAGTSAGSISPATSALAISASCAFCMMLRMASGSRPS